MSSSLGSIAKSVFAMAYRPVDSKLYGWDYSSDATGNISTANGAWSVLNASPGGQSRSPKGGHYTMMNDTMYAIYYDNSLGGRFATIGYTNTSNFQTIALNATLFQTMVPANDGTTLFGLYGDNVIGNQKLYTIDTSTGVATAGPSISGTGLGLVFHGAAIAVPEPSTWILAAIATGVMAAAARRRMARQG